MPPNITFYNDSVYEQGFECPLIMDSHVATKLTTFNLYKEKDEDPSMRLNCIISVTKCLPKVKRQFHIYPLLSSIHFSKDYHRKVSKSNPDPLLLAIEQAREVNGKSNASKVCFDLSKNEIIDGKTESPNKSSRQTMCVSVGSIRNDSSNPKHESKTLAGWNMSFPMDQSFNSHNESKFLSKQIQSILQKGQKELFKFNYTDAASYFVTASEKLKKHGYPPHHSLQKKTFDFLQYTYHAEKTMEYSVQIVKMGLRHEARGEFRKALKKYTVAYQMRKDLFEHPLHLQVSRLDDQPRRHPSLAVLLNLLGGVRLKMGELDEALQSYELSLYGQRNSRDIIIQDTTAPGTTAVTMREIGSIYEQRGELDIALKYYLDSLDFVLSSTC
jgi:tetratricopeptide (TPR) repeat protein